MCDTLGKLGNNRSIFAKNSDRSPNEVQVLEFYSAQDHKSGDVACTYITIPQASHTYAVLLSRPCWMWGAEIGVNEHGLCIGNEAVFTKGAYGKTGLTGMDLVRLALERSRNAKSAVDTITSLLETYGQGGNCGYDHSFFYDNSFLIMDRTSLYVLETSGKQWVCKLYSEASISNRLSIGADGDMYSGGSAYNFCKKHLEPVYSTFSGSARRRAQTQACVPCLTTIENAIEALCSHHPNVKNPFARGTVSSPCMHYGGLVGDHTTASMVVSLEDKRTVIWATGCSAPCVSLFKPWLMGSAPILPIIAPEDPAGKAYWLEAEAFRRSLLGKQLPKAFYEEKDAIQARWISESEKLPNEAFSDFSRKCLEEEAVFYQKWQGYSFHKARCVPGFASRWEKKNKAL